MLMKSILLRRLRQHFAIALVSALIPWLALAGPSRSGHRAARAAQERSRSLELSRPVRPWEFLCAVGTRAGLLGNEAGRMEAWVYPLKLLRDFRLRFHTEGRVLPAETLARTLITRPESSTIVYTGDTFSVRETFFVPVNEPGAIISLEVETEFPLEIEARFLRDFQLEWPAALGGTYSFWDKDQRAFYLGEETKKFAAFVGSPTATEEHGEYQTNYSESAVNSFRLGITNKGKDTKLIVIAGSLDGRPHASGSNLQEIGRQLRGVVASVRGVLQKISERHGQRGIAGFADPASLRLVSREHAARNCEQYVPGTGLGRRLSHLGRKPASRIRLVFRARFVVDVPRAQRRGRFCYHAHGAAIHQQISARRREDAARNRAGCKLRSLVQGFSLRLCLR